MSFFSTSLARDGSRLSYHMNPVLRGLILFAFLSVMAMFVTVFTPDSFTEAPLFGKINTIVIPLLLFIGSFYRFSVVFDKRSRTIEIQRGLVFLYAREKFTFDDFHGVKKSTPFRAHTFEVFGYKTGFGLYLGPRLYLLERSVAVDKAQTMFNLLIAFYPENVPVLE